MRTRFTEEINRFYDEASPYFKCVFPKVEFVENTPPHAIDAYNKFLCLCDEFEEREIDTMFS